MGILRTVFAASAVLAAGLAVHGDALATLLDLLGQNVDDLVIGEVPATRDPLILCSGQRHADGLKALLVA